MAEYPIHIRVAAYLLLLSFVGGCTQDSSQGSAGDTAPTAAQPAAVPEPADTAATRDVTAESLPYAEIGSELVYGYFAIPGDVIDPPAVLVIHDWWGVNDDIRDKTVRLAGQGYIVLAVDLFQGRSANTVSGARELEIEALENPERVQSNIRQAIDFMRISSGTDEVAIVGYGLGGGVALTAAINMADRLSAAVSYYGPVQLDEERLQAASTPFLGFYAEEDRAVRVESVRTFADIITAVSRQADVQIYSDARRGFADRASANFDPATSDRAWRHMLAFLGEHLSR